MRTVWMWFYLSCRRWLHRRSFLIILLLLPAAVFLIRQAEVKEGTEIRIAVAVLSPSDADVLVDGRLPLERELADALTDRKPGGDSGMFRFYECGSEEEVKAEVASRRAECGYVILDGLRTRLDENDYRRCIRIYTAPSTVAAKLSSEVVFAELICLYDRELFASYAADGNVFEGALQQGVSREALADQADELYQKWSENGSTFRFVYEVCDVYDSDNGAAGQQDNTLNENDGHPTGDPIRDSAAVSLFPARGIAAIYIFIAGLYSAAVTAEDEKKGLFLALPYRLRAVCQTMETAAPVTLAGISGLAALYAAGAVRSGRAAQELLAMAAYLAAVTIFACLLRLICRRAEVIYCLIPMFLIGSLIFCPVFVDVSRYLPALSGVGRLFLPWYYLRLGL